MNLLGFLFVGFLLGVRHALDPDHLASVASFSNGKLRDGIRQGAVWGIGHTLTLLLFGGAMLLFGSLVAEDLASVLEMVVGVMLVILGADAIRRVARGRLHLHVHQHGAEDSHLHMHAHRESAEHKHEHSLGFPYRALFVGLMHGIAGSAGLVLLTLAAVPSVTSALLYISVFGMGSMLGMALLSVAIGMPLRISRGRFLAVQRGFRLVIGIVTIVLGLSIVRAFAAAAFG